MNTKRSEVTKACPKDAKKPSEEKDGANEGDYYDGDDPEDEEATAADAVPDDDKRRKVLLLGSRKNGSREATLPGCQAEKCDTDLSDAKKYHRRHKVCEVHAKAPTVIVAGIRQRFCQQCSRFHEVGEFDESKRSCRRRLAGHNERRRKSGTSDYHGENSSRSRAGATQTKESQCRQPDEGGRVPIVIPGNQAHQAIR